MKVFIKSIIIFFISYHNLNAKSSWNKKYVQNKNGLIYVPTSKLPYTGEVFSLDDNGNITESIFYENGKIKSEKQVYLKWY